MTPNQIKAAQYQIKGMVTDMEPAPNSAQSLPAAQVNAVWLPTDQGGEVMTDHAKLIASLELAARHNDCAELLLEAARAIRELSEAAK